MRRLRIPDCPYCGAASVLVTGAVVYPHIPRLADKPIWLCKPCGAYVGCHPGTVVPLGRLANLELRTAKVMAHAAFDPLWKAKARRDDISKNKARGAGYRWLAEQLGIDPKDCHIGMMDVETCRRVERICNGARRRG